MAGDTAAARSWRIEGPTTLNSYDHDAVYLLVRVDTDDPELERELALVGAWDREGDQFAQLIAAAPRLLAACQAVVEHAPQQGDLVDAAQSCAQAIQLATGGEAMADQQSPCSAKRADLTKQRLVKAKTAHFEPED